MQISGRFEAVLLLITLRMRRYRPLLRPVFHVGHLVLGDRRRNLPAHVHEMRLRFRARLSHTSVKGAVKIEKFFDQGAV